MAELEIFFCPQTNCSLLRHPAQAAGGLRKGRTLRSDPGQVGRGDEGDNDNADDEMMNYDE